MRAFRRALKRKRIVLDDTEPDLVLENRVSRGRGPRFKPFSKSTYHKKRLTALKLWNQDVLGSFEVATLSRLHHLTCQLDEQLSAVKDPVPILNSFEYRERQLLQGMPISKSDLKRREQAKLHNKEVLAQKELRRSNSKAFKRHGVKVEAKLGGRRCLISLIKINMCCGQKHKPSGTPDQEVRFLCADDIFNCRAKMLEVDRRKWLLEQCQTIGKGSFTYDRDIELCDDCFCELYDIKVLT